MKPSSGGVLAACGLFLMLTACGRTRLDNSAEHLIGKGWDDYRLGEFSLALKDFQQAMRHAPPGSAVYLRSLYGLATTWNMQRPNNDDVLAEKLYRQLIALAPTNDLAAWSWLALAHMSADPRAGEAIALQRRVDTYQEVITSTSS